jgi:hypothetical protein
MQKLQKRLLNQILHLANEAEKLCERVHALCPEEYRAGQVVDESADFLPYEWNLASVAAYDLAFSLASIAVLLDPDSD